MIPGRIAAGAALAAATLCLAATGAAFAAEAPVPDSSWLLRSFEQNLIECGVAQPPEWCARWREILDQTRILPAPEVNTENPDFGLPSGNATPPAPPRRPTPPPPTPPVAEADWQAVLQRLSRQDYRRQDLAAIRAMAEFGSADALEILGWMYAQGVMVGRDDVRAYTYYGRALLAGATHVRPNLDLVWARLTPEQQTRLRQRFESQDR